MTYVRDVDTHRLLGAPLTGTTCRGGQLPSSRMLCLGKDLSDRERQCWQRAYIP